MKKSESTRLSILQKSFELIYAQGYQSTSIDDILATTKVTKGAFYYHFKNKDEMGIAIIHELLKPALTQDFEKQLKSDQSPLDAIYKLMYNLLMKNDFLKLEFGCPAANFTQEMAPWNEAFTEALKEITELWAMTMNKAVEEGKKNGFVRKDVSPKQVTLFVTSSYWGIRNFGKLENSNKVYKQYLKELRSYLDSLK